MNDTPLTRESLLTGIESLSCRISSFAALRRVWKILDRQYEHECADCPDNQIDNMQKRIAPHYYARHLAQTDSHLQGGNQKMTTEQSALIDCITRMLKRTSLRNLRIAYEFVLALTADEGGKQE